MPRALTPAWLCLSPRRRPGRRLARI